MAYSGGKGGAGVYQNIINQMPPHDIYIEPFLGAGAVLKAKKPSRCSIAVDIDPDVIAGFRDPGIPNLKLFCCDALGFLSGYPLSKNVLIYLDPPYLMSTRSSKKRLYKFEFSTQAQHLELLSLIKKIPAMVIISSYFSDLYQSNLQGWGAIDFYTTNRRGKRTKETLWMNYPQPTILHDYSFLGRNFRERERIRRRLHRWKRRLSSIALLERNALIHALLKHTDHPL